MKLSQRLVITSAMAVAIQNVVNGYCDTCIELVKLDADLQNRFTLLEMNKAIAKGTFDAESHADTLIWRGQRTERAVQNFIDFKNGLEAAKFPFSREIKSKGIVTVVSMEMSEDMSEVILSYESEMRDDVALAFLELIPEILVYMTRVYQTAFRESPVSAIAAFGDKLDAILQNDMDTDAPSDTSLEEDAA